MWIPPAYSPIQLSGILRGLFAGPSAADELEARLKEWYSAERALATASGTHALQLAIRAALKHTGSEGPVALPAFNCFDLASAAIWVGAPVVFYDIDPETLSPEPDALAAAVDEAGALVVAYLFGFPMDWDLIRELADGRRIPVVEDAAQGMGTEWKGQAAGTFGDLSVLSFGRGKGWTGGSGGAVMARNGFGSALPNALPENPGSRIVEGGKTAAVWLLARPTLYGIPARLPGLGLGETHYKPPTEPEGITPFAAEMVTAGRDASLAEAETRRRNARKIREELEKEFGPIIPRPLEGNGSGYLRFPFFPGGDLLEDRRRGIYRSYPRALPELGVWEGMAVQGRGFSGSSRLAAQLVTLPTHNRSRPSRPIGGLDRESTPENPDKTPEPR